jgi:hypothetical protein
MKVRALITEQETLLSLGCTMSLIAVLPSTNKGWRVAINVTATVAAVAAIARILSSLSNEKLKCESCFPWLETTSCSYDFVLI